MDEKEICRAVVTFGGRYNYLKMVKKSGNLAKIVNRFKSLVLNDWNHLGTELQKDVKNLSQILVDKGWRGNISRKEVGLLNLSNDVLTKS